MIKPVQASAIQLLCSSCLVVTRDVSDIHNTAINRPRRRVQIHSMTFDAQHLLSGLMCVAIKQVAPPSHYLEPLLRLGRRSLAEITATEEWSWLETFDLDRPDLATPLGSEGSETWSGDGE